MVYLRLPTGLALTAIKEVKLIFKNLAEVKMEMSGWESLLLGALLLLVMFWMWPGIRSSITMSKQAKSDWPGLLVPIGFVVIFVIFLIAMV